MKKIITALLNETVNNKLKEYKEIQVIMKDIQYQEGILEALEINHEIEYIIFSELLPGNLNIKELVEKIKKLNNNIKMIIILERENNELENFLISKGNINIFYNNQIEIKNIVELIINENKKENLELEIKKLKEMILNKDENVENFKTEKDDEDNEYILSEKEKREIENELEKEYKENLIKNKILSNSIIKNITKIFTKEKKIDNSKLIIITGIAGVGKSVFIINLAKALESQKKKTLIIDFDFINNSIQTLFGIKNNNNKKEQVQSKISLENIIIKISSKINLISNINLLFQEYKIEEIQLLKIINSLKTKYDVIIFDVDNKEEYINYLNEMVNKIIFITESNILQIKKSKQLLEKYKEEINIQKDKLYILFNKVKYDSIEFNILKEVFRNYNMLGKIGFIKNCNTLINNNMSNIFLEKRIKKQYQEISKRILQNNKVKDYYLSKI